MKKVLIVLALMLLPSALFAQGALRVASIDGGKAEVRSASSNTFAPLSKDQQVQPGDQVRTGPNASLILMVPDGSYMVVSENSTIVVDDFWSGNFRSIVNLMIGQVRFYIQKFGGRPNPTSVRTPTALIAVRGTTFDVIVDDAAFSEVRCYDGQVTVENIALGDREVVLSPGFKTMVRPNEVPQKPVLNDAELDPRKIRLQQKNVPDRDLNGVPSIDALARDNDRRNRQSDSQNSASQTNSNTQRAKPTLSYPR